MQTGVKSVQETTVDDGRIGLLLSGYATRWGETDLAGEVMTREAFGGIKDEWGAAKRPSVAFNHGQDPAIGFRPIGECTRWPMRRGDRRRQLRVTHIRLTPPHILPAAAPSAALMPRVTR
jgi:hypothetical protein